MTEKYGAKENVTQNIFYWIRFLFEIGQNELYIKYNGFLAKSPDKYTQLMYSPSWNKINVLFKIRPVKGSYFINNDNNVVKCDSAV